jgi:hypothetical protein
MSTGFASANVKLYKSERSWGIPIFLRLGLLGSDEISQIYDAKREHRRSPQAGQQGNTTISVERPMRMTEIRPLSESY